MVKVWKTVRSPEEQRKAESFRACAQFAESFATHQQRSTAPTQARVIQRKARKLKHKFLLKPGGLCMRVPEVLLEIVYLLWLTLAELCCLSEVVARSQDPAAGKGGRAGEQSKEHLHSGQWLYPEPEFPVVC